jgi:hypothetical protein
MVFNVTDFKCKIQLNCNCPTSITKTICQQDFNWNTNAFYITLWIESSIKWFIATWNSIMTLNTILRSLFKKLSLFFYFFIIFNWGTLAMFKILSGQIWVTGYFGQPLTYPYFTILPLTYCVSLYNHKL